MREAQGFWDGEQHEGYPESVLTRYYSTGSYSLLCSDSRTVALIQSFFGFFVASKKEK